MRGKQRFPRRPLALGVAALLVLAACGAAPATTPEPSDTPGATDGGNGEQGRFTGVELTLAGAAGQIEYVEKWTSQWSEETGATVTINAIPFSDIDDRVLTATGTDTFLADVYNIGTGLAGQLMAQQRVLEIPSELQGRLELDDLAPLFRNYQLDWGGTMYAAPWDCDVLNLYYRNDLLSDVEHQSQFEEQYGYALAPPTTWDEYGDIAEYFTENTDLYGLVELPMRRNHAWNGFNSRATAYAKHPDDAGYFFDPDTMEPRINNPGFVQALEDWSEAMQWGPPDMLNYGWAENMQSFVSGQAVLNVQWGDIGPISHDPEMSVVAGDLGYDLLPGRSEVYNPQSGEWEQVGEPNRAPFAGFGGWIWVVPDLTQHPEAALDLATYLGRPEVLADASVTPGTGVNPCYTSLLEDTQAWVDAGFPDEEEARAYTQAIQDSITHPNAVLDLRIPGVPEYKDALELAISRALAGQASPQDALDEAAATWEQITDRLGRDEQARYYRESLGVGE